MKKEIKTLIINFNTKYKQHKIWKYIIGILSCIVTIITITSLTSPAITLNDTTSYNLYLKDSYNDESKYSWKFENNYQTEYKLNLYFEDTLGNSIEGKDVTLEISPNTLIDVPYGFGITPLEGENIRGKDLIEILNLKEYTLITGEKYIFDHAEVYVDGIWQTFANTGNHWHIWCQSSSATSTPTDYGWRGNYGESTRYIITEETKYKFVYKLVRYGKKNSVASLGADSGITFKLFNYTGDNSQTGINDNGIYNYFTFRGIGNAEDKFINQTLDADGFTENRAKVLPNLDNEGYPIFNCQGQCINPSLGYLFGSNTNPNNITPKGVTNYNPTNTLLQKETIDEVEYYYYDSNKNAVDYDTENNSFILRNYVERSFSTTTYQNEADRYEFLPFNYLNDTKNITTLTNPSNNRIYNYETSELDHWYGMTMEFTFYMPKSGIINGKDMIFSFSGDDDVWVFIDNVLVLDLGGTHGAVDGTINFRTGTVESYLNWNGSTNNKNTTTIYNSYINANAINTTNWNESNTTYANYTKHTLKFFYLERGASVANCKIKFNIPVLPSGSLTVQKQFVDTDNYNENYEFILYDVTSSTPVSNTKYTIGDNKYTTDTNGKFTLKNTEVAIFQLTNEHKYYVEESNPGLHAISHQCTFDNTNCPKINKTPEFTINPESTYHAIFTNKVKTFNLDISKIAYDSEETETFEFKIKLRDKKDLPVDIEDDINSTYLVDHEAGIITFTLKNNETITIKDIPINTIVTLQETKHDGYQTIIKSGDIVLANKDTHTFKLDANKTITIHNIPGIILPETGGVGLWPYLIIGFSLIITVTIFIKIYSKKIERR